VADLAEKHAAELRPRVQALRQLSRALPKVGADYPALWAFGRAMEFLLTSQDTDFYDRSVLLGRAPEGGPAADRQRHDGTDLLRHKYNLTRPFHDAASAMRLPLHRTWCDRRRKWACSPAPKQRARFTPSCAAKESSL